MDRLAIFGSPLSHSLSPWTHQAFAEQAQKNVAYEKILTKQGALKAALRQFKEEGGRGANVTSPLKVEAFELCDGLTQAARDALAVNTLFWENGRLWGDNTDGEGFGAFVKKYLNLSLKDKHILVLGSGGGARGILIPILNLAPSQMVLVTRSPDRARLFANYPQVKIYDYDQFTQAKELPFDMVINATSLSLTDTLPPINGRWAKNAIVIDLPYFQHKRTIFLQWALGHGAKQAHDGIGMLVWQGAFSFQRWFNFLPDPNPIIADLKGSHNKVSELLYY